MHFAVSPSVWDQERLCDAHLVGWYGYVILTDTHNQWSVTNLAGTSFQTNTQTQDQGNEMWKSADLKKGGTPDTAQFNNKVHGRRPGASTSCTIILGITRVP